MIKMKASSLLVILFPVLLIAGIFLPESLSAAQFDPQDMKEASDSQADKGTAVKETASVPVEIARPKVEYKAAGLKDPFQPAIQEEITVSASAAAENADAAKPMPSLTLKGMIWGGNFPQAIINNKVVRVGDMIGDAQIVDIGKEGVVVLYANKKYRLSSPAATGPRQKEQTKGGSDENEY